MTDTVDDVIRDLQAGVARELAAACERLRAATRAPTQQAADPSRIQDLILPGAAVHLSGFSRGHLHRLCKLHPIGGLLGFSCRYDGESNYWVSESLFREFLKQRPRRKMRRKETKKPANETQ